MTSLVQMTLTEAHNHPERENLRSFQAAVGLPEHLRLFLREESSGELHRITQLEMEGEFGWTQAAIDLQAASFGDIAFLHGSMNLGGQKALAVAKLSGQQPTLAIRIYPEGKEPKPARGHRDK